MEHGSPTLAEELAACQQRIRELEQTDAEQKAVIAEQQQVIGNRQRIAVGG